MKTTLTIAGSDSSGGAGIQADIKTMTMHGVYAMSAITALTAQNTLGVRAIYEVTPEFLKEQLDAVFEDIFPDSVKIGMVSSAKLITVIADTLKFFKAKNIVLDPVMVSTSGSRLMNTDAVSALTEKLFPLAKALAGMKICHKEEMEKAATHLGKRFKCNILLKGGHSLSDADDLLYENGRLIWFSGKRIDNPNTHGTGCTLSSAIASNLAKGLSLSESIKKAKAYLCTILSENLNLGKGSGPLKHNLNIHRYP